MAAYKEQYYSLEEYEMQDLIDRAKKGHNDAQVELIKVFNNFLMKYTSMIYHGRYNLNDYDIRRFIALFVKDNYARMHLVRNKLNSQSVKVVNETMRRNYIHG
jgi:hypothetical protein